MDKPLMQRYLMLFVAGLLSATMTPHATADDIVIADFESGSYEGWTVKGEAFGKAPAEGTLPKQMTVTGYRGRRLVNTFIRGDATTGEATSAEFKIERSHIAFLIGGGPHKETLGIELLVDGKRVRSATGPESETLEWANWDVREWAGQTAKLRIFDRATGGWGHINVDHIMQTNLPPKRFDLEGKLAAYRQSAQYMQEPLRPQFHFSPEINWMNDPNGLVYHDGEYHLFFQYNPAGNSWGHMSWGHAVSKDLARWRHLPLAIPEADGVMAFSGCCVVDHKNTSGFGASSTPPMVAIYTGHGHGKQVQNLAYSNDRGRTWTKYANNPVLDIQNADFRDPKVFWHEPTRRWVMVVSLAAKKVLIFYSSPDLKSWTELSRFGPDGAKKKPNWECPDLFPLPVESAAGKLLEPAQAMWVLEADMGSGSVAGGSGGEYFVGQFDGTKFTKSQDAQWVDFGRDFYAPVSWDNIPKSDGRRIWIGWFNNWETNLIPTDPWRSCMSVPRTLRLRQVPDTSQRTETAKSKFVLVQRPVKELNALKGDPIALDVSRLGWPPAPVHRPSHVRDLPMVIDTDWSPGNARSLGLRIRTGAEEYTEVGYDAASGDQKRGVVYVDRRKSGNVKFHPAFAGRHEAPARLRGGRVKLQIWVDRSTIEVFINDGEAVISDRIFPTRHAPSVEAFIGSPSAKMHSLSITPLKSIWKK